MMRCAIALLVTLASAAPSRAAFTVSDLSGTYGFELSLDGRASILGTLTFDGAGSVTSGSRYVMEHMFDWRPLGPVLEQSSTGTYEVLPDGRVRVELAWTPDLPAYGESFADGSQRVSRLHATESWWGALTGDGFRFFTRVLHDRLEISPTGAVTSASVQPGFQWMGIAERASGCGGDTAPAATAAPRRRER